MTPTEKKKEYDQLRYARKRDEILCQNLAWNKANRGHVRERQRAWRHRNPGRQAALVRAWRNEHLTEHRKYAAAYQKKLRADSPGLRILDSIRTRLWELTKGKKSDKTVALIGCSTEPLRVWLTFFFQPGMTWDNYGKWQVDHIRPCRIFDFTDPAQQRECFHFTNLQPLWAKDNKMKGASY